MKLTTKGRYAVTAMLDLAMQSGPVPLLEISRRQGISLSYLEQLFAKLRRHELVRSRRGPGGGYELNRSPEEISVADVIRAVDEPMDATACSGKGNCHEGHMCLTHHLWESLSDRISDYLQSISLASVLAKQGVRQEKTDKPDLEFDRVMAS
jgi:Rrf2 family iron-sulfur cluster assembly transcriptional regulator